MAMIPGAPPQGVVGPNIPQANPEALAAELAQVMQRAEEILAQLESMGIDPAQLMGGAVEEPPVPGVPAMGEMAVSGPVEAPPGLIA